MAGTLSLDALDSWYKRCTQVTLSSTIPLIFDEFEDGWVFCEDEMSGVSSVIQNHSLHSTNLLQSLPGLCIDGTQAMMETTKDGT